MFHCYGNIQIFMVNCLSWKLMYQPIFEGNISIVLSLSFKWKAVISWYKLLILRRPLESTLSYLFLEVAWFSRFRLEVSWLWNYILSSKNWSKVSKFFTKKMILFCSFEKCLSLYMITTLNVTFTRAYKEEEVTICFK